MATNNKPNNAYDLELELEQSSEQLRKEFDRLRKIERSFNQLKGIAPTAYAVNGNAPVTSVFRFDVEELQRIVKKWVGAYLNDIDSVSIITDEKTGKIDCWIWLPDNSPNTTDNSLNVDDAAYKTVSKSYSKKLVEVFNRFCTDKDDKRLFHAQNGRFDGIRIDLSKVLELEMDVNGRAYKTMVFADKEIKTKMNLVGDYAKTERGKYGKLNFVEVTKSRSISNAKKMLYPKRSCNV